MIVTGSINTRIFIPPKLYGSSLLGRLGCSPFFSHVRCVYPFLGAVFVTRMWERWVHVFPHFKLLLPFFWVFSSGEPFFPFHPTKTWKKKGDAQKFADLQNKGTKMNARVIKK